MRTERGHTRRGRGRSPVFRCALVHLCAAVGIVALCGCGNDSDSSPPSRIAVLSAFPAELAAYLDRATVTDTVDIGTHVFRVGALGGVPVVMGLTGIGLTNAATTTRALLERFDISGIVFSGVAGSPLQIGDVTVPAAWETADGTTYAAHQAWLDLANEIAAPGLVSLERCTTVPSAAQNPVCMPQPPAIVVGGVGRSSDPFGANPFPCQPNGGDLYGCDVMPGGATTASMARAPALAVAPLAADAPVANDMETAAVAREATQRGIAFIAFRAVSDGAGDPLGLGGFLPQFSDYYHFAAHNAAAGMVAFLEKLAATPGHGE